MLPHRRQRLSLRPRPQRAVMHVPKASANTIAGSSAPSVPMVATNLW